MANILLVKSLVSIQDLNGELSLLLFLIAAAGGFFIVSRIVSLGRSLVDYPLGRSLVNQSVSLSFKDDIGTAALGTAALGTAALGKSFINYPLRKSLADQSMTLNF